MKAQIFLLFFFFITQNGFAQKNYIKGVLIGIPLFQAGAVIANAGYEHFDEDLHSSWQISLNFSAGQVAADASSTKRKWITIDRNYYFNKKKSIIKDFFCTFFIESGNRTILPGMIEPEGDSLLNNKKAFEINPGIGLGKNFSIKKRWHLQIFGGPKEIIGFHTDSYYHLSGRSNSETKYNNLRTGFRFLINLCYQL